MVTAVYVLFGASILMAVHGRSPDHHQPQQRRLAALKFGVKVLLLASMSIPAIVVINLVIKVVLGPDVAEPVVASLVCQLAGVAVLWPSYVARVNKVDFDVYRQDAQPT
jgi:hypothetical protein